MLMYVLAGVTVAAAGTSGKELYQRDCARCHGDDGKGAAPSMRAVPGYVSVDLTLLSNENGGRFPRQEVQDAIEGSTRFPAHLIGGMPLWGRIYAPGPNPAAKDQQQAREKIAVLTDYIESLQSK